MDGPEEKNGTAGRDCAVLGKIPQIIWMYWHSGETNSPPLSRICFRSWRERNPEFDVRVISEESLLTYVNPGDVVPDWRLLPVVKQTNLIRLMLLAKYGGIWADATLYCARPIRDWGLSASRTSCVTVVVPESSDKILDTFFIASRPAGAFITHWLREYVKFIMPIPTQISSATTKRLLNRYPLLKPRLMRWLFATMLVRDRVGAPYFAAQYVATKMLLIRPSAAWSWITNPKLRVGKFSRLLKKPEALDILGADLRSGNYNFWKFSNRVPEEFHEKQLEVETLLVRSLEK